MSDSNATFNELCDAAAALPRTVDRAVWGEQGYLVGNFMFARFGVDSRGAFALVKLGREAQAQAIAANGAWVAAAPEKWLEQAGWVLARPRDAADVDTTKRLVQSGHDLFANGAH